MNWETLFGSAKLQKQDSEVSVNEALSGKIVGIYFSAHWCGPCRGFTPELIKTYNKIKADGKNFEIVFASSDRTAKDFDGYYKEMPWLALDFDERDIKQTLSKKFKVQGIPTLVILDEKGNAISTDGRESVTEDSTGANFPWIPPTFDSLLQKAQFIKDGKTFAFDALKGKTLGLYFSASWCPPCKIFSPILISCYKKLVERKENVEFIYISSDKDETSFKEYFGHMPFAAVVFADRTTKSALSNLFKIEGIPSFVMISPEGKIINSNARGAVTNDQDGKEFPWHPKPVIDVSEGPDGINEFPSAVLFLDAVSEKEVKDKLVEQYTDVAKSYIAKHQNEDDDGHIKFFTVKDGSPLGKRIRDLAELGADKNPGARLLILNIPDGTFQLFENSVTSGENISTFVTNFSEGKLGPAKSLS